MDIHYGISDLRNMDNILKMVAEVNPQKIVDIGCGIGNYGVVLRRVYPNAEIIAIEGWLENRNDQWNNYNGIIIGDARTIDMPKADLYLMIDIIEHMSKEEGLALITKLSAPILVCTPIGWPQGPGPNPYHEHLSEWSQNDFNFLINMSYDEFVLGVINPYNQK